MKYRFTDDSVATTAFFEADLMGDVYDPPGVEVYRDDEGVPWFEIRQELADEFDADPRFERYDKTDEEANE